ncbi:uncharacterized protein LOC120276171 [Dioscorea cayenensis subsp. rotundata]|uniref:Uncharacterized protein LOC120276171 n=1 Tax=Dioscorea cayennensis subsp. rotundata TaxID=55577 RepID=A0AB40CG60_DIOCR|nr:uncharacterized protein LOC120276171 [Dioscorea cayenensis subsp. rotundata]
MAVGLGGGHLVILTQMASAGESFHPNIQTARSSSDVKAYVEKEGDFTNWGEFQIDGRSSRNGPLNLAKVYAEALNTSSVADSLQIIKEKDPKSFFLQYHNLKANAECIFARPISVFQSKQDYSSFVVDTCIAQWLEDNFFVNGASRPKGNNKYILRTVIDRPMSLILEGPSRTGKTAWARSLGRYNYICGHMDFNANNFKNDVMYNLIDDVAP